MRIENILNDAQQIPSLAGLVLSGGKSERMGVDKGEINYYKKSQRKYLHELLMMHCETAFVSCNSAQSKSITDTPKIEDAFSDIGPLNGILSAFYAYPEFAFLSIPCDLPFINSETIRHLIQASGQL